MRPAATSVLVLACLLASCAEVRPRDSLACVAKPLASLPVVFDADVPTTTVYLDGAPVSLVLDLGAQTSVLSEDVVDRLHLRRDPTALPTITGVGGSNTRWAATVRRLALGGVVLSDKRVEVAPIAMFGARQVIDGALGLDVLRQYDVDWDLPNHRVTLSAPSDCDGPPAGWPTPAVAVPLSHPPGHGGNSVPPPLLLPLLVDDQPVVAMLDSGAGISMIDAGTAASLEAPATGGGTTVTLSGVGSDTQSGRMQRFRSIALGGDTLAGWPMVVAPVPTWTGGMILGVGFMRMHRTWLPANASTIWFGPRATRLAVPPPQ